MSGGAAVAEWTTAATARVSNRVVYREVAQHVFSGDGRWRAGPVPGASHGVCGECLRRCAANKKPPVQAALQHLMTPPRTGVVTPTTPHPSQCPNDSVFAV